MAESGLAVPSNAAAILRQQWAGLGAPGTWWSGAERVAITATARAGRHADIASGDTDTSDTSALSPPALRAVTLVSTAAHRADRQLVDELETEGLDPLAYTEIVGIVARVVAMDTALRGVGVALPTLPSPQPGEPSRQSVDGARRRSAFVPMVGGAGPATALSAVAQEDRDQEELHGALYLAYSEMAELQIEKGLTRAQMETIAARVSLLNDCHF